MLLSGLPHNNPPERTSSTGMALYLASQTVLQPVGLLLKGMVQVFGLIRDLP